MDKILLTQLLRLYIILIILAITIRRIDILARDALAAM